MEKHLRLSVRGLLLLCTHVAELRTATDALHAARTQLASLEDERREESARNQLVVHRLEAMTKQV